jgi:GDP-D-mannose dehydratase
MDVQVNPAFVRANEVYRLCGSPDKLLRATGALPAHGLEQTLSWMLEMAGNGHAV